VEIPSIKWEKQRTAALDKDFKHAVADFLRRRWPTGTAKETARTYDLSLDKAREAVAGRASLTTVEQIMKRGGWSVTLVIMTEVLGQQLAQHLTEIRVSHDRNAQRLAALSHDLWLVSDSRGDDPPGVDVRQAERRITDRRREGESQAG